MPADLVRATRAATGVPPYINEMVQWGAGPAREHLPDPWPARRAVCTGGYT